jgi:2'-hydroxyisoflavone reductase
MNVLVIGGTAFIGRLLVEELLKAGHEVAILHRKPKHDLGRRVENLEADRNDGAAVAPALAGRRFDVVFDNAYDWERGTTAAQVEATVAACGNRISRYVYMSSVAAYGDGLNHKESDPLASEYHASPYVRHKATAERMLFSLHREKGLPVVTLRPPFVYGPGNPFYREAFFWDRMRAGRPVIVPGDGYRLMQFVFVRDLVAAMLRAMDEPKAVGEAFNVADTRPVTQSELVEKLGRAAGVEPVVVRVPRDQIVQAGGKVMEAPYYFGEYFDLPPITENVSKVVRVLKLRPVSFEEGLKETYRWYVRARAARPRDYEFEDRLISLAGAGSTVQA